MLEGEALLIPTWDTWQYQDRELWKSYYGVNIFFLKIPESSEDLISAAVRKYF